MSSTEPARVDRRRVRHEQSKQQVIDTAWMQAREVGLAGLSLRAIARAVHMEPQSLYTYFASKSDLYDAMFAQGNAELLRRQRATTAATAGDEPVQAFRQGMRTFVEFCVEDGARFSLMFQRTVPGFSPGPASMACAREVLDDAVAALARVGVDAQRDVDLFLALVTGLVSQQVTNDPGGSRWIDSLDDALDMFLSHVARATTDSALRAPVAPPALLAAPVPEAGADR